MNLKFPVKNYEVQIPKKTNTFKQVQFAFLKF